MLQFVQFSDYCVTEVSHSLHIAILMLQFVQFSDYCVTERSHSAASTLFVQNQAKLAKAVLAEVPLQLTEYMKYRNIAPPNQTIG